MARAATPTPRRDFRIAFLPLNNWKRLNCRTFAAVLKPICQPWQCDCPFGPELEQLSEVRRLSMLPVGGYPRPRYGATPCSGTHMPLGSLPVCQNTSIGMPPRGY